MSPYVLILFYSRQGSVKKMAELLARGVGSVPQIEAKIRTVPPISATCEATSPTVPVEGAPFVELEELANASGIIIGSPTRFGNMAAPMKYFIDNTGSLWANGSLVNKPVAFFTSSDSLHGGQESTLLSMMLPFLHHGAILVGLPYTESDLATTRTGGTPYGATHVTFGDQNAPLSPEEKNLCTVLGKRVATLSLQFLKT